jgi:tetratricopeptide (TPR) repeat protein
VTNAANDGNNKFLADLPPEIREMLDWYAGRGARSNPRPKLTEFASKFLGGMNEDQAIIPTLGVSPAELLALTLLHHQKNPENPAAWLNLGIALRRMALRRPEDSPAVNERRLRLALETFERSLHLDADNAPKNVRALSGEAMTYHQLGLFEDEVRCCEHALAIDSTDSHTWLLYVFALGAAGRREDALRAVEGACKAYVAAGEPEELRPLFEDVVQQFRSA